MPGYILHSNSETFFPTEHNDIFYIQIDGAPDLRFVKTLMTLLQSK